MGQVFEIPFSALEAALLLKKEKVTYNEVMDLYNKINRLGKDYYVLDDDDYPNLVYIQNLIEFDNEGIMLKRGVYFNSIVNDNKTVRDLFEECAGEALLNFVGYEHVEDNFNEGKKNNKIKSLFKGRNLLFNKNNKLKVGV